MNTATVINLQEKSAEKLAREYVEYKRIEKDAKKALEEIQSQLIAILNGCEEMTAGMFTVRNKRYTQKSLDSTKLKTDLPEVYELYSKTAERSRFTVGV